MDPEFELCVAVEFIVIEGVGGLGREPVESGSEVCVDGVEELNAFLEACGVVDPWDGVKEDVGEQDGALVTDFLEVVEGSDEVFGTVFPLENAIDDLLEGFAFAVHGVTDELHATLGVIFGEEAFLGFSFDEEFGGFFEFSSEFIWGHGGYPLG